MLLYIILCCVVPLLFFSCVLFVCFVCFVFWGCVYVLCWSGVVLLLFIVFLYFIMLRMCIMCFVCYRCCSVIYSLFRYYRCEFSFGCFACVCIVGGVLENVLLFYVFVFAILLCVCPLFCLIVVHYMIMFVCCFVL